VEILQRRYAESWARKDRVEVDVAVTVESPRELLEARIAEATKRLGPIDVPALPQASENGHG
jgi:hypothetical protein